MHRTRGASVGGPCGDDQTDYSADGGEHEALRGDQPEQRGPARPDRRAHGQLPLSRGPPRHEQVGHVGARDHQENHDRGRPCRPSPGPGRAGGFRSGDHLGRSGRTRRVRARVRDRTRGSQ